MSKKQKQKKRTSQIKNVALKNSNPIINIQDKYKYAIYRIDKPIQLNAEFNNTIIPKGETVLMPTNMNMKERTFIGKLEQYINPLKSSSKINNKNLLIIRYGGIGDIITSLYSIAELKIKYNGNVKIGYCASFKNLPLLHCFPKLIDGTFGPLIPISLLSKFKNFVYLEDIIENSPLAKDKPIHDIYASQFGVSVDKNTTKLVTSMNLAFTENKRKGIGIQYKSNAIIRDYNIEKTIELINELNDKYKEPIYLLGPPDDYQYINYIQTKTEGRVIPNGCGLTEKMQLPHIINLISSLKLVIGPDSSMLHIAGICETPCIGLFGPFHSDLRLSYYNKAIGINGKTDCSPCFRHFPLDFCKYTNGHSICTNSITTEMILEQVEQIL